MINSSFFELSSKIYKDVGFWIPENPELIIKQHANIPKHSYKVFQTENSRLVGYIQEKLDCAFFGFWETLEDNESNERVFKDFESWVRKNQIRHVYGPINISTFYNNRLRMDCFEYPQFQDEPVNPTYYPELLYGLDYKIIHTYSTRYHNNISELAESLLIRKETIYCSEFKITQLTPDFWNDNIDELYTVINSIFENNFGFTGVSKNSFVRDISESIREKMCPISSVVAISKLDNSIAGFFIGYPDYGPILRQDNANRVSSSSVTFNDYVKLPRPRMCLAKTAGVLPKYRSNRLFTLLGIELIVRASKHYDRLSGTLIRDDNNSNGFSLICPHKRTYGMFTKEIV